MRAQRYSWVDPEESVQWASMRRAVEVLRERRNRVLALVGPLNEHAMEDVTRDGLRELRRVMTEWLTHEGVAFVAPDALASEMYADVSHPLADGYRRLAHLIEPELSRIR